MALVPVSMLGEILRDNTGRAQEFRFDGKVYDYKVCECHADEWKPTQDFVRQSACGECRDGARDEG
jgi:hypothetical protein